MPETKRYTLSDKFRHKKDMSVLKSAVEAIPSDITDLDISGSALSGKTAEECALLFSLLSKNIKSLDLAGNYLASRTIEELTIMFAPLTEIVAFDLGNERFLCKGFSYLERLFTTLPPTVTDLNFRNNAVDEDTIKAFEFLPQRINTLRFEYIPFGTDNTALKTFFESLKNHQGIRHIKLQNMSLGYASGDLLEQTFAQTPPAVKELDLTMNDFGKSPANAIKAIKALPASLSILNLSRNNLENMTTEELIQFMQALPAGITRLILSKNNLGSKKPEDLAKIVAAIPKHVQELDLSMNDFSRRRANAIKVLPASLSILWNLIVDKLGFKALPKSLSILNLSSNHLDKMATEELIQFMQALPESITRLILSKNNLGSKSPEDLAKIVAAIPKHVQVDLSSNMIFSRHGTRKETAERDKILTLLQNDWHRLILSDNGESDLARFLGPLTSMMIQGTVLPTEYLVTLCSYLSMDNKTPVSSSILLRQINDTLEFQAKKQTRIELQNAAQGIIGELINHADKSNKSAFFPNPDSYLIPTVTELKMKVEQASDLSDLETILNNFFKLHPPEEKSFSLLLYRALEKVPNSPWKREEPRATAQQPQIN